MQEAKYTVKRKLFEDPVTKEDVEVVVKLAIGRDIKIVNYHVQTYSEEKLGFLGAHRHLIVRILRRGSEEKEIHAFFVKSVPYENATQTLVIEDSKAFFKETNFYKHIMPELMNSVKDKFKSWVAQCYLVKDDVMIFEDLKSKNFRIRGHFLDVQSFKSSLNALAHLHASSLLAEKRMGKTFKEIYPNLVKESLFDRKVKFYDWYRTGVDVTFSVAKHLGLDNTKVRQYCDRIFDKLATSEKWSNVLCHGDLKSFNMMFDDSSATPKCVLVDFQLLRYCPAMADLSQMMYLSTRRELRERYESDILTYYHESLCAILKENNKEIKIPMLEEILQEFIDMRIVGVVTASLYFPIQLIEGKRCAILTENSDGFSKLLFEDRVELVLDTMKIDQQYNEIITEIITELIERSHKLTTL